MKCKLCVEAVAVERGDQAGLVHVEVEERHEEGSRLSSTKEAIPRTPFDKIKHDPPSSQPDRHIMAGDRRFIQQEFRKYLEQV